MKFSDETIERVSAARARGRREIGRILDELTADDLVIALASMLPDMVPASQAIRDAAFEEAGKLCEALNPMFGKRLAEKIRALKSKT